MNKQDKDRAIVNFRVDGDSEIGLGHFTRCLAMAQMLKENFVITFYMYKSNTAMHNRLTRNSIQFVGLENAAMDYFYSLIEPNSITVLDGYSFVSEDQKKIKEKTKLVVIDDLIKGEYYADVIINQALNASVENYKKQPYSKVLSGSDYIMLRKPFFNKLSNSIDVKSNTQPVFICMGGADPKKLTLKFTKIGVKLGLSINVVIGSAYQGDLSDFDECNDVRVWHNVSAEKMVEIIDESHICFVSASGIAYECASRGKPILIGYYLAHQMEFYNSLAQHDQFVGIGNLLALSEDQFFRHINALRDSQPKLKLIDGKQQMRYLNIFNELYSG